MEELVNLYRFVFFRHSALDAESPINIEIAGQARNDENDKIYI